MRCATMRRRPSPGSIGPGATAIRGIAYLLYDPFILRFKDDPRFAAFCRKVGLPVPGAASASKST